MCWAFVRDFAALCAVGDTADLSAGLGLAGRDGISADAALARDGPAQGGFRKPDLGRSRVVSVELLLRRFLLALVSSMKCGD